MPIDTNGIVTHSVAHPREAYQLAGISFITPWLTVEPDRAHQYEKAAYLDRIPHPYANSGYGDDLLDGYYLLSLLDVLINHSLWAERDWVSWNYGLDAVRFLSPVRLTDRFRVRGKVLEVLPKRDIGQLLVIDCSAEVDGRDKPGFVATQRLLWASV